MIEIIPAIMPDSYSDLCQKAQQVAGLTPFSQIDIMDGIFVPSKSWPYTEGGVDREPHFLKMRAQEESLPEWEDIDYEIDLMIAEPENHIEEWLPLGASRLIFHIESIKNIEKFFSHDLFAEGARDIGGDRVIHIGLALNPDTPFSLIEPHLSKIDFIQCMGIKRIGYQGESFDDEVLERIHHLRIVHPNLPIAVDGGVNLTTAHDLIAAGASRLTAGSAIFLSPDVEEAIVTLQNA